MFGRLRLRPVLDFGELLELRGRSAGCAPHAVRGRRAARKSSTVPKLEVSGARSDEEPAGESFLFVAMSVVG